MARAASISCFEFLGHQVEVQVFDHGAQWSWEFAIDGGAPVRMVGPGVWSEHRAAEDAGLVARDQIRQLCYPRWPHGGLGPQNVGV